VGWGNENRLAGGRENRLAGGRDCKDSERRSADVKVEMGMVQAIGWNGGRIWMFIGIHAWF
jgi:hypothetical protein